MARIAVHVTVAAPEVDDPYGAGPYEVLPGIDQDRQNWLQMTRTYDRVVPLDGPRASYEEVTGTLKEQLQAMRTGDLLLFTFSGHGGLLPDFDREPGEGSHDETLVLHDAHLVDDEIRGMLSHAPAGAYVAGVADSCNSATVAFLLKPDVPPVDLAAPPRPVRSASSAFPDLQGTVLWMSGARDDQQAYGDDLGGFFTRAIATARDAAPEATWQELWNVASHHTERVARSRSMHQSPVATAAGPHVRALLETRAFDRPTAT